MIKTNLTYKDAGVDIPKGNELINRIKPLAKKTRRPGVLGGIGGFGALFELPLQRFTNPILVSSTDGVGTKLKLAIELNQHNTIGIDLVAMCANDIVVQGAEPLFFLDYFATGQLDIDKGESILSGIAKGCELANIALIGGETAEMPGMYSNEDYDLAGFVVGIVDKQKLITGKTIYSGDVLLGLPSSGLHSNGFSLVRKVLQVSNTALSDPFEDSTIGQILLTPTKIYVQTLLKLFERVSVKGLAHITGGGLLENIPRILPDYTEAKIDLKSWRMPPIFNWLEAKGNIPFEEMLLTFNCGVGMIICVAKEDYKQALTSLKELGEDPWVIGEIITSSEQKPVVTLNDNK